MCLVRYAPPLNKVEGTLSFDLFRSVVDDLPDLEKVTLQGLGEPLLAPDLFRMIEYAALRGIRTGFNTNATLLSRKRAQRLVLAGLDWLCISLDGATPATYEGVRDGSSFERLRRNVLGLVDVMRELDADRPRLSVVFVAMRRNVAELEDVIRLAHEWGILRVRVQNLSHSFSDTDPAGGYREIREFTAAEALWRGPDEPVGVEAFANARRVAQELGVDLRLPSLRAQETKRRRGSPGCGWPWGEVYVTHDGKIEPCCMIMGSERATLGDVSVDSFPDIWWGESYTEFRRALLADEPPEVCRGCSMYRGVF